MTAPTPDFSPGAAAEAPRADEVQAAVDYEAMAAQVDLSDLAVVRRHVFTANPKEWPKPLLYALLAALEANERERERLAKIEAAAKEFLSYSQRARRSTPDPEEWYIESESLAAALAPSTPPDLREDAPISRAVAGSMRREMDSIADERDAAVAALEAKDGEVERLREALDAAATVEVVRCAIQGTVDGAGLENLTARDLARVAIETIRDAAAALAPSTPKEGDATAVAALEAKDGEVARLRVAWQRSLAMLRAAYPHPDHVPLVVERVIDMMAAALAPSTPKEGDATAVAALEAKDGEVARLRVAWQRSLAMLRAAYPHPDHVPLVVERVIDMMAAALAPSTPKEGE